MSFWTDVVRPLATAAAIVYTGGLAAAAVGGGALGAAITFGSRVLAVNAISSLISKKPDAGSDTSNASLGNRVQAGPSTTNKLSVVYGNAFMPGVLTDVKISADQKYMWFVYALSEVTDTGSISFDDPSNAGYPLAYWNDKKLEFNATDRTSVDALVDLSTGTAVRNTKVAGKIKCYFFADGSSNPLYNAPNAITVLSDASTGGGIASAQRWTSTNLMSKTAFMIIRIQYDQDANLTSVSPVTAYVRNTLNEPGSVAIDYMMNSRYGCGIEESLINTIAFIGDGGLNAYSSELIDFNDSAGVGQQARYVINGPLDTSKSCIENLNHIMDACDSWMQWDETLGKWSVVMNRSFSQAGFSINDLFTVYCDTVYEDTGSPTPATYHAFATSGIPITPNDLNNMYNQVEVQFPSKLIKDNIDYAYITLPTALMNPNEPINKTVVSLPIVNDSVQAQYIGTRRLEMARDDLIIGMDVDFAGIQIEAGDIIRVYHKAYGWDQNFDTTPALTGYGKLFRITQVQETKRDDGTLGAHLLMSEYNDTIYGDNNITAFAPAKNTGLTDPTNIGIPNAPVVGTVTSDGAIPKFELIMTTPSVGTVTQMEVWYALASSAPTSTVTFKLWETQYYNNGPVFPNSSSVTTIISGLPAVVSGYNYYFRIRAAGTRSKSDFSTNSAAFNWNPNPTATVVGQNFQAIYQPNPILIPVSSNGTPNLANVNVRLYGLSGPGQVNYTGVTTNAAMDTNTWRIDIPNIAYDGITFSSEPTDAGTYAQWPTPTSLTSNIASITSPIIYKDNTGNMFTSPPAILSLSKATQGEQGSRGVVTLAYVPVTYDPTYGTATDSQLSTSFFAVTGFNTPINNDGAVFFNETTDTASARVYDTAGIPFKWKSATLQVPGSTVTANSITGNQIKNNTIYGNNIIAGTITGNKITANTITANNISSDSIQTRHLTAGSITTTTLAANSITTDKLQANSITSINIAAEAITSDKIQANSITGDKIYANTIDSSKLQAFTITSGQIAAGTITGENIRANTINFDNLVIGAVTQSKSTISEPSVAIQPFFNWTTSPKTWPDNTRCITPTGGVTIIPTTDPQSSANTQYTEGSRIEVSFSVKLYTSANSEYNCVELWKSGASSRFDRGFNSLRHTYNTSGKATVEQLHAYGYGTNMDWVSYDGGASWSTYEGNTTTDTIVASTNMIYDVVGGVAYLSTDAVGPLQNSDVNSALTGFGAWRYDGNPGNTAYHNLRWDPSDLRPSGAFYKNSMLSLEISPYTGGNGVGYTSSTMSQIMTGVNGDIFYLKGYVTPVTSYTSSNISRENVSGLLKDLYSNYSNKPASNNTYTAMICGQSGTILKSNRTMGSNGSWQSKPTYFSYPDTNIPDTTRPLTVNLFGIAGNDTIPSGSSVWVAVGQYGTIMVSLNDGEDWIQVQTPITSDLYAVRFCNGFWTVCGANGVVMTSSAPQTAWTIVNHNITTQSLNTIDYSYTWDRINIGGQGIILTSSGSTVNFSAPSATNFGPTETYDLTRLTYFGSWPTVSDSTLPPPEQRILNNQVFNSTTVDTAYVAGQETTYYLVIGNMKGSPVYAGQVYLQVTEVKR